MNWYLQVLRNFGDFAGRSRRQEYWMFVLFNTIFGIAAVIIDNLAGIAINGSAYGPIYLIYALITIIPGLAVTVRRLHDTGKSGWMLLVALIPFLGAIWLIVLLATPGETQQNAHGYNPKGETGLEDSTDSATGDHLLLAIIIFMFANRIFWLLIPKILGIDFYNSAVFKNANLVINFIWAFVPLAMAFALKNKTRQLPMFIVGALYLLFSLYDVFQQMLMQHFSLF